MKVVGLIFLVMGALFALTSVEEKKKIDKEAIVAYEVNEYYHSQLLFFKKELFSLDSLIEIGLVEEELKTDFLEVREAFKSAEFLLSYQDNKDARRLNGANLILNEYDSRAPMEEEQPHGLQVIEDLIYNPEPNSRVELIREVTLLKQLLEKFIDRNEKQQILSPHYYNVTVWDALRYEIYRIEALGLTGFDVPESKNSIPECRSALASVSKVISYYEPIFKAKKNVEQLSRAQSIFQEANSYLQNNTDFNTFDRLHFMTEYLHPISSWLKESIELLGYNYPSNTRPINVDANHLFDQNSLNRDYFSPNSTRESIALGEKLFNDPILSSDESRSCASCHIADKGFADAMVFNTSIHGDQFLQRNTPSLWNVCFQTKQFYDSRVEKLEKQSLDVIHNQLEMGGDLSKTIHKLAKDDRYNHLFFEAYQGNISEFTVVSAISDYVRSLISINSRFDLYMRGDFTALNESEKNGFNLFAGKAKCATCHFIPVFNGLVPPFYTETESEILGVPANLSFPKQIDSDLGKHQSTQLEIHKYSFKTSGIRNSEITAPYMHNGVFPTLMDVINFYNKGGGVGQGMELPSQTLPSDSLRLTESEKNDLVNFIKSLTDVN